MAISYAERRLAELSTLVNCQLQIIRTLEKTGKDSTSAKIVFDSLRVSLFLATQDLHRARRNNGLKAVVGPGTAEDLASGHKQKFPVRISRPISGPPLLEVSGKNSETENRAEPGENLSTPNIEPRLRNGSLDLFEFRPLTDEEKKDFISSLGPERKRPLGDKAATTRSGGSAA